MINLTMPFPNFYKSPKKVFLQKFLWKWHDDRTLILSLLLELLRLSQNFKFTADLIKTPGHADPLQGKDQEHAEKIIPERVFLFLSLLF